MKQEKKFENIKFRLVPYRNSPSRRKKKYFWLALILTKVILLVLIPGGIIGYKAFSKKTQIKWLLENETSKINDNCFENVIQIFNINQWSLEKNYFNNLTSEFRYCKEYWNGLESIPSVYKLFINNTQSICRSNFNIFINVDILLIFNRIINTYELKLLKLVFGEYHKKLSSAKNMEDFIQFLNSLDFNKIKFYIAYIKEHNWNLQLSDFGNVISLTKELDYWYQYLDSLENFLSNYEQQKQKELYRKIVTEKNFSFFVIQSQKKLRCPKYNFTVTEKKLQEINKVITEWTKETVVEKNKMFLKISNKILLIREVKEKLKNYSGYQTIYIFASHSLILDEDLKLPGTNIALIAPVWVFFKKIKINLNGVDGKSSSMPLKNGQPGEAGYPGGHGGDFFGIGITDFEFLNISNTGGNGGPGQNGLTGLDGTNFTIPNFFNTSKCTSKIKTHPEILNSEATYYKIFNELGCGKNGTDGGVGGFGGKGGKVVMINKSNSKFSMGLDGTLGIPGKGGKGGSGSKKGCYYEAALIHKNLIPVTRISCLYDTILPSGISGRDNANSKNQLQQTEKINLNFFDPIIKFYQFAAVNLEDNQILLSFLNDQAVWKPTLIYIDFVKKFKAINNLKNLKLYELFQQEIHSIPQNNRNVTLNLLMALTKGKILTLKYDINYSFLDLNNYLTTIQQNIENVKYEPIIKYQTSFIKSKLDYRLHKINVNLKNLRSKFQYMKESNDNLVKNLLEKVSNNIDRIQEASYLDDLIIFLQEGRFIQIVEIVTEIVDVYVEKISLGYLTEGKNIEFKNFVFRQILIFNDTEKNKKNFFNSFSEFFTNERQTLSRFITKEMNVKKYKAIFKKIVKFLPNLAEEEKAWINALEIISEIGLKRGKHKEIVENFKQSISAFSDSFGFKSELKFFIEEFIENLQNLIELDNIFQWCESEQEFKKLLDDLSLEVVDNKNKIDKLLINELNNVIVEIYYKLAIDAVERQVWPFLQLVRNLQPTNNRSVAEEALLQINKFHLIIKSMNFCTNKHQANFHANSAVGEFYFWPNEEIQLKIKKLFQGFPIYIKADINNHHILDKNLVRMKTLRLEFVCGRYKNSQECKNIFFSNIIYFKIQLTHSGYSLFNWKENIFNIISDELTFDFSLKTETNGEPEFYNAIFKKLEHGKINISPYTTWKIQLIPVNQLANFTNLLPFVNHIDLRLVGVGTFFT